jgi:hypothetical protein
MKKKNTPMKLTSIFLGSAERGALAYLVRTSGKNRSECMRNAIRDAADRITLDEEEKIVRLAAAPRRKQT